MTVGGFDPEILQDFLTESGELLEQLEGDLVDLESNPANPELLNQIFRALHTIKGSASFLALTNLVELAHCAESALNAARNGQVRVERGEMDLLLEAVDILKAQFGQLNAGQTDLVKAKAELLTTLTAIGEGRQVADGAGHAPPAATTTATALAEANDAAETPSADGRTVAPLRLDDSKSVLLDHLVADVEGTLEQIQSQLDALADDAARGPASQRLAELSDDLTKTVEFFEFDGMLALVRLLTDASEQAGQMPGDQARALVPELQTLRTLLGEQSAGLKRSELVSFATDALADRIARLLDGEQPAEVAPTTGRNADAPGAPAQPADATPTATAAPTTQPNTTPQATQPTKLDVNQPAIEANAQPSAQSTAAAAGNAAPSVEQTIRVEVGRLEALMNLVGELVLQKNRVTALAADLGRTDAVGQDLLEQFELTSGTLDRVTGDIQVAVMRTRMQPLEKLFGKYPRLIRDLAKKTGKQIQLVIEGAETEVDKSVIEELGDPLVHLLRNSADHGVEPPADRAKAGKPELGTITLRAAHQGSHVLVEVIDDGRGLPRDRIARKAVERGLATEEQIATLTDEQVFRFIFEPGFSTAEQVSDLSGRGVGMDVVRTNIEKKLKGTIEIASTLGKGTKLSILIPLTVAIMPAMMVAVAGEIYAVPLTNITEIVRPTEEQLATIGESPVIRLRGTVIPLVSAQKAFQVAEDKRTDEPFVVVLQLHDKAMGLRVCRVIGQQEIVIKPLDGVERAGPVSGATVRNDGGVSLIVDVGELIRRSRV